LHALANLPSRPLVDGWGGVIEAAELVRAALSGSREEKPEAWKIERQYKVSGDEWVDWSIEYSEDAAWDAAEELAGDGAIPVRVIPMVGLPPLYSRPGSTRAEGTQS
jgi:hypothetical protein